MSNDFLNSPLYVIAFGCAYLQLSGSQSRKREKWIRGSGEHLAPNLQIPWKLLHQGEEKFATVVKVATVSSHICASSTRHRSLNQPVKNRPPVCRGQDPYWHPRATSKVLWEHTHGCPPWAVAWGIGRCGSPWNLIEQNSVQFTIQDFPEILQASKRLQGSKEVPSDRCCPWKVVLAESQSPGASCAAGWTECTFLTTAFL